MTTLQKVLLVIALAMLVALLCGNGPNRRERLVEIDPPHNPEHIPDLDFYQRVFLAYDDAYFHGRLNMPTIRVEEIESSFQMEADTECKDNGTDCVLQFAPKYNVAPRDALLHELHEMCHIKTWSDDQNKVILGPDDLTRHGKHWRGCMLDLDNQGAWRNIIIDFYQGAE